tara:strand:- start:96 stop:401 length:306 start_codon:yes stop_codon:yes gene_type:complete
MKTERLNKGMRRLIDNDQTQVMGAIVADAMQAHQTGDYESIMDETKYFGTTEENGLIVSKWGYKPYANDVRYKPLAQNIIVHYHFEIRESDSEFYITTVRA